MASRSGKSKTTRPPTPQRAAAMKAYKDTFGREPKRSMSIKDMKASVAREGLSKERTAKISEAYRRVTTSPEGLSKQEKPPNKGGPAKPNPIMREGYDRLATDTRRAAENQTGATRDRLTKLADQHQVTAAKYAIPVSNDSQHGITTGSDTRSPVEKARGDARRAYTDAGGRDQRGRMFEALSGQPRVTSDSLGTRIRAAMPSGQTVNRVMMGTGIAVAAGRGYREAKADGKSTGEAVIAGAKSAAVPAAIAASPAIATAARHVASGAFAVAGAAAENIGMMDYMLGMWSAKIAGVAGLTGVAAKGVEFAAKGASRVAMPAIAAYSAYQGAKEAKAKGENMTVGAARGVVRAVDPTAIFMKRGVGERIFDAGVNAASTSRMAASFHQANARFVASHQTGGVEAAPSGVAAGKRGFGNPANQAAAQKAKGNDYKGPQ